MKGDEERRKEKQEKGRERREKCREGVILGIILRIEGGQGRSTHTLSFPSFLLHCIPFT